MGTVYLSRVEGSWGLSLTTRFLALSLKKEYSYTSTPPLGLHGLLLGRSLPFTFYVLYLVANDYVLSSCFICNQLILISEGVCAKRSPTN